MVRRRTAVAVPTSPLLLTGCGGGAGATGRRTPPTAEARTATPEVQAEQAPRGIPGLGPGRPAATPGRCARAVVVTGRGKNSPLSTVVLHERTATGRQAGTARPARNARDGWSAPHVLGGPRSPLGGHTREPLDGCFDHVVAVDHNRGPGTSPPDRTRPLGPEHGGGVWPHADHGGPTHGCVSVARTVVKELLRALGPARHPVAVMGYADWLAGRAA
ncbi:hypothetical protein [Streptomyces sp. NPDC001135]